MVEFGREKYSINLNGNLILSAIEVWPSVKNGGVATSFLNFKK